MLPTVGIVSIVKDESPYIADWVAHHVYFGVDNFHFMVNRTSDATVSIIRSLSNIYSSITYEFVDWIDYCHPKIQGSLQQISYSKAFSELNFDYFLFLDLDEYWTPSDFQSSIKKNIVDNNFPKVTYYQWHCECGVSEEFKNFRVNNSYYLMLLGKSLINKDAKIDMFRAHIPVTNEKVLMSNGQPFKSKIKPPQFVHESVSGVRDCFVVHRMYRSELEYVARLMNGNPDSRKTIKNNRKSGFKISAKEEFSFNIEPAVLNDYESFISDFTKSSRSEILISKEVIYEKYNIFFKSIPSLYIEDAELLKNSLGGITNSDINMLIEELDGMSIDPTSFKEKIDHYKALGNDSLVNAYQFGFDAFAK